MWCPSRHSVGPQWASICCLPSQQYETTWISAPQTWACGRWAAVAPPLPSVPSQPPGFSQMKLTFLLSLKVWLCRPVCHRSASDKASPRIGLPPPSHNDQNQTGHSLENTTSGQVWMLTLPLVSLPSQAYLRRYDSCVTTRASARDSLSPLAFLCLRNSLLCIKRGKRKFTPPCA